jgi:hypothetical protein
MHAAGYDKGSIKLWHLSKELPFVVPAELMEVLVAIGPEEIVYFRTILWH